MPARTQELRVGIGFEKQTELQTGLAAASLWSLNIDTVPTVIPTLNRETNAAFFGKGHPFATTTFPLSLDTGLEISNFLTSQHWAQTICFAAGVFTESTPGTGAYQYVAEPSQADPIVNGIDMPATTIVGGIRPGATGEILDMALIGMVCTGFTLTFERGPGLQNSKLVSRWAGCGKFTNNSGIAIPPLYNEQRLGSGSCTTLLIKGVDYLALKNFIRMELTYETGFSPDSGYYIGSGQQQGYDIRGRMRFGDPTIRCVWTIEGEAGLQELADLVNDTDVPMTVALEGDLIGAVKHTAKFEFPTAKHLAVTQEDADGYFALGMTTEPLFNGSTGPIILTAITDKSGIGVAA